MASVNRSQEFVRHRLDHDEALRRDARLPVVLHPRRHRGPHGVVEVGRSQHDERIGASELEDALLQGVPGRRRHGHTGLLAPGEGDGSNPRVLDECGDVLALDEEIGERPRRQAGPAEDVLQEERRLGDVGRVLEQADVAHHERGRGKAHHLPEREVPRHDGQDRADGLVVHVRARGTGGDRFVGQQGFGVLGEPAQAQGALRGLGACGGERLAHLGGHDARDVRPLTLEEIRRVAEMAGPLGEAGGAVLEEGVEGLLQQLLHLGRGVRRKRLLGLTGGGVDGGVGHEPILTAVRPLVRRRGTEGPEAIRAAQAQMLGDGPPDQLPGGRVRQLRRGEIVLGPLVGRQVTRRHRPQGLLDPAGLGVGDIGHADLLAPLLVGHPEHRQLDEPRHAESTASTSAG